MKRFRSNKKARCHIGAPAHFPLFSEVSRCLRNCSGPFWDCGTTHVSSYCLIVLFNIFLFKKLNKILGGARDQREFGYCRILILLFADDVLLASANQNFECTR